MLSGFNYFDHNVLAFETDILISRMNTVVTHDFHLNQVLLKMKGAG